jgi:transcriptional regulator with XRE-family HTH domain
LISDTRSLAGDREGEQRKAITLKEARAGKFTLASLAVATGVSDTTLGSLENMEKTLTLQMAERLAEVLKVDAVELYARHAISQMQAAIDTASAINYRPTNVSLGLARIKLALDLNRVLDGLECCERSNVPEPVLSEFLVNDDFVHAFSLE